jgi:transcriptional regulator with XRE-family HTH domain
VKEKLAERIRLSRLSKGLSQQNVADELGITVAAYSNIERGITDISVSRVFQIAAILEVNAMGLIMEQYQEIATEPHPVENYTTSLTQQVYMLIQQVQQLTSRMDQMDKEVAALKHN